VKNVGCTWGMVWHMSKDSVSCHIFSPCSVRIQFHVVVLLLLYFLLLMGETSFYFFRIHAKTKLLNA